MVDGVSEIGSGEASPASTTGVVSPAPPKKMRPSPSPEQIRRSATKRMAAWRSMPGNRARERERERRLYRRNHTPEWIERRRQKDKRYRTGHVVSIRRRRAVYARARAARDPAYRLKLRLRTEVGNALRRIGEYKRPGTFARLRYTPVMALAKLFVEPHPCPGGCGTTITGIGPGIDIDHIMPLARATTAEEVWELFRLENLRLVCHPCNLARRYAPLGCDGRLMSDRTIRVSE